MAKQFYLRRAGVIAVLIHLLAIAALIVFLVRAIIRATHSDTEISGFVKKLLPAGNCLCQSSTVFECSLSLLEQSKKEVDTSGRIKTDWKFEYDRDSLNFGLTRDQCNVAFPGYFEEVFRAVEVRKSYGSNVTVDDLDAIRLSRGMVRAMIADRKLRVLESKHGDEDHRKKGLAILHSIYRSISTDGRPIPNIEFVFSIEDMVDHPSMPFWTLSRRPRDHNLWLMPDFGFWSWDLQDLGTLDDVVEEVVRYEASTGWATKIQKLVWRGKPQMLPKLRRSLLDVTKDKPWSDVAGLIPGPTRVAENYLSAADQCKYMFLAHAEGTVLVHLLLVQLEGQNSDRVAGRSYSGSLKYRQICHSVVFIHKLQWIQHHHYLFVANGTKQNFVEVERDFSDLEEKVEYLIAHPEEAERIADNSVKTFRDHYFAPAAEACYWRALIQGWAESSFEPQLYVSKPGSNLARPRGMRFENFA